MPDGSWKSEMEGIHDEGPVVLRGIEKTYATQAGSRCGRPIRSVMHMLQCNGKRAREIDPPCGQSPETATRKNFGGACSVSAADSGTVEGKGMLAVSTASEFAPDKITGTSLLASQ